MHVFSSLLSNALESRVPIKLPCQQVKASMPTITVFKKAHKATTEWLYFPKSFLNLKTWPSLW